MAVDDLGTEVLKKAAEELIPGDKSDYFIKFRDSDLKAVADDILIALGSESSTTQLHLSGTVGTSSIPLPATAGDRITEVLIDNDNISQDLLVSFDGGTDFKTVPPGGFLIWNLKRSRTQIDLEASAAGATFEILMNRQP